MRLMVALPLILAVNSAEASDPIGITLNASWSGKGGSHSHSTKIVTLGNSLLFRTNWDSSIKPVKGGNPIKVIEIPAAGGSSCKTIHNTIEDISWESSYCVSLKKIGFKSDVKYTIRSKVLDAAPDALENYPGLVGKIYNEYYNFSIVRDTNSCKAILTGAQVGKLGSSIDILRNPILASCTVKNG